MNPDRIKITFDGMEPTEALKDYTVDKLMKYDNFLETATSITVVMVETEHARGVDQDFSVDITVQIPGKVMHVEEVGGDMYALIDKATDLIARRLRKREEKQIGQNRS